MMWLLGCCTIQNEESCHLILETSMVSCSHTFVKINLKSNSVHRVNLNTTYNADEITGSNKTPEKKQNNREAKNNDSGKINILDIWYAHRMKVSHWASRLEFETENHYHNFVIMSLHTFSKYSMQETNLKKHSWLRSIKWINIL